MLKRLGRKRTISATYFEMHKKITRHLGWTKGGRRDGWTDYVVIKK